MADGVRSCCLSEWWPRSGQLAAPSRSALGSLSSSISSNCEANLHPTVGDPVNSKEFGFELYRLSHTQWIGTFVKVVIIKLLFVMFRIIREQCFALCLSTAATKNILNGWFFTTVAMLRIREALFCVVCRIIASPHRLRNRWVRQIYACIMKS